MKIRLIGLGREGQRLVRATAQHFTALGLDEYLERRYVVRVSTPFAQTLVNIEGAITAAGSDPTERERLALRIGLGRLFFGSRGDNSAKFQAVLADIERRMSRSVRDKIVVQRDDGLKIHNAELQQVGRDLGVDDNAYRWFIAPRVPTRGPEVFGNALIGAELIDYFPEADHRYGELVDGLGTTEVDVDIVAVAFQLTDAFGVEAACRLCQSIRRILQTKDANRIVSLVGLAVVGTGEYPVGRYLGQYYRLAKQSLPLFDALFTRVDEAAALHEFPRAMAALALASNRWSLQTDNPDANQLQRDFGRCLVGFAAATADDVPHGDPPVNRDPETPDPRGGVERFTARKVIAYIGYDGRLSGRELKQLRRCLEADFPRARPVIYRCNLLSARDGKPESPPEADATGPSILDLYKFAYARWVEGHCVRGKRLQQVFAQEAKDQAWATADWMKALVAAAPYGLNPPPIARMTVAPPAPAPAPPPAHGGRIRRILSRPQPIAQVPRKPLSRYLVLYVVDALDTSSVERIADLIVTNGEVEQTGDPKNGIWLAPRQGEKPEAHDRAKLRFVARSFVSVPQATETWQPRRKGRDVWTGASRSSIARPDAAFIDEVKAAVSNALRGSKREADPFEARTKNFNNEAQAVAETINRDPNRLANTPDRLLLDRSWVADVLVGLNLTCNDQTERRRVGSSVANLFLDVHRQNQVRVSNPGAGVALTDF